ncbi:rho GTPase-activating protein 11A-like [Rhinophrynus dorsalis]
MRATGPSIAIIQHLKCLGIKIRPLKKVPSPDVQRKTSSEGLFGIPLQLLPLCIKEGNVPRFVVDACQFLSSHIGTEGLFRKSGSVTRIKTLKAQLESGQSCLLSSQPSDVAALLKQFFRELPLPLIPPELQDPLCQIQDSLSEGERESATTLVTCLLPAIHVGTLRYFCTFLNNVASRCDKNRMDSSNLAVVLAPNLFSSTGLGDKLTLGTERQLQLQTAVMQTLIEEAQNIGQLPSFILEKFPLPHDEDSVTPNGGVPRRRRRRSMGGLVNEALSKLKSGRAVPSTITDPAPVEMDQPQSYKTKRKASEDGGGGEQCTAKKRKSLRESPDENLSIEDPFEPPGSKSPYRELSAESPALPGTPEPSSRGQRGRGKRKDNKRAQRGHSGYVCVSPAQLDRKEKVRSSLRLFHRTRTTKQSTPEGKNGEQSGWNLMKKMVSEALEGPIFNGRDFRANSLSLKAADQVIPLIGPSSPLSHYSSPPPSRSSPCWKSRDNEELERTSSARKRRTLRRSLSMPENLGECAEDEPDRLCQVEDPSLHGRGVLQEGRDLGGTEEKASIDSESCSLISPAELQMDVFNAEKNLSPFHRQVSVSEVPHNSHSLRRPNGQTSHYRSVRKLVLSFPWAPHILAPEHQQKDWEELATHPIKRKGARRFGRSLSHESGLGTAEEHGGQKPQSPSSPPKTLSGRGRQIFVSRKNITLSSSGQRSLETGDSVSLDTDLPDLEGQSLEKLLVPSWDPSLVQQVVHGEKRTYRCSPKCPISGARLEPICDSMDF